MIMRKQFGKKKLLSILKFLVIEHKISVVPPVFNLLIHQSKNYFIKPIFCDLHVLLKCICRNLVSYVC